MAADPLRMVLHPVHAPGLPGALQATPGLDLVLPPDDDAVAGELERGASALVTYRWDDRFATDAVQWVQAVSTGVDQFPLDLLQERGIVLTSARGAHSPAVAEHAIALVLAVVRGVGPAMRNAVAHRWEPLHAHEVSGRTMGILGLGSIGEAIAVKAAALGMRVIGTKRYPLSYRGVAEAHPPGATLAVCHQADVLVLVLPELPSTIGIVGRVELEALGAGWLVNVGRGSALDEGALLEALTAGELRGAGLDVTASEPLPPDSPLWDAPGVVLTPHMAWATDRLADRVADIVAVNAAAFRRRGPWLNRIV